MRPTLFLTALGALVGMFSSGAPGSSLGSGSIRVDPASPYARIQTAQAAGDIDESRAMLLRFQLAFEPAELPRRYLPPASGAPVTHLRCGTPLLLDYHGALHRIEPRTRRAIEEYLAPKVEGDPASSQYLSPSGRFLLTFATSGDHAVDTTDTDPLNGVPDFVERVASYCDEAWRVQIDRLGFAPPPLEGRPYWISFEKMGFYGYTQIDADAPGGTRIVLNHRFVGFPPNDDPEGNRLGAAKATVAHELKHAVQYATSSWIEGNWLELDATWVEDLVFDEVNDYYNYLPSGSPISAPETSLDAGGGGSYEDCVWQHYLSERFGAAIIVDLWQRRASPSAESMLDSYDRVLAERGSSLAEAWPMFTAWNHATGSHAVVGLGYEESAAYPTAPVTATVASFPATLSGSVDELAANVVLCSGFSGRPGWLQLDFTRAPGSALDLTAVISQSTGVTRIEGLQISGESTTLLLPARLEQIESVALVVANGATEGWPRAWALEVREVVEEPEPSLSLSAESLSVVVEEGERSDLSLELGNDGEPGSVLDYRIHVMASPPPPVAGKSVTGSTLEAVDARYEPGTTANLTFVATNNSPDDEWLTGIRMTFPAGVTVLASSDFVGGTEGPLVSDDVTGEGVTVAWADENGGFGNVYGRGEQAHAVMTLAFDAALEEEVIVDFELTGDEWGDAPHVVTGSCSLSPPPDALDLLEPRGGTFVPIGSILDIRWESSGTIREVGLERSQDLGTTWQTLTASTPNDGQFAWQVVGPATGGARIRVRSLDGTLASSSPAFSIYTPLPWITATPTTGALDASESETIVLTVDAAELAAGQYEAWVAVDPGWGDLKMVQVIVTVQPAATGTPHRALAFGIVNNVPNPFNPATTITFRLVRPGLAHVDVYDASGRRVKRALERWLTSGEHQVRWNGDDDSGRPVASGVYHARLSCEGDSDVRPMVLVR